MLSGYCQKKKNQSYADFYSNMCTVNFNSIFQKRKLDRELRKHLEKATECLQLATSPKLYSLELNSSLFRIKVNKNSCLLSLYQKRSTVVGLNILYLT